MNKTNSGKKASGFKRKGHSKAPLSQIFVFLAVFCCISQVYGADNQRNPIDVNLIIDGSTALLNVKEDFTAWISSHLDQVLADGDTVTVWNAGTTASVIYTSKINGISDRDAVRKSIGDLAVSGDKADFSGALTAVDTQIKTAGQNREQQSIFSYTLLVSASQRTLTSLLSGSDANLLRFSRVEEFPGWRVIVVGLNLDTKVRRAAANFINAQ